MFRSQGNDLPDHPSCVPSSSSSSSRKRKADPNLPACVQSDGALPPISTLFEDLRTLPPPIPTNVSSGNHPNHHPYPTNQMGPPPPSFSLSPQQHSNPSHRSSTQIPHSRVFTSQQYHRATGSSSSSSTRRPVPSPSPGLVGTVHSSLELPPFEPMLNQPDQFEYIEENPSSFSYSSCASPPCQSPPYPQPMQFDMDPSPEVISIDRSEIFSPPPLHHHQQGGLSYPQPSPTFFPNGRNSSQNTLPKFRPTEPHHHPPRNQKLPQIDPLFPSLSNSFHPPPTSSSRFQQIEEEGPPRNIFHSEPSLPQYDFLKSQDDHLQREEEFVSRPTPQGQTILSSSSSCSSSPSRSQKKKTKDPPLHSPHTLGKEEEDEEGEKKTSKKKSPKQKSSRKRRKLWDPQSMKKAIELVENHHMSARAASMMCNVPRSTLWDRLSGRVFNDRNKKLEFDEFHTTKWRTDF